VDYHRGMPTEVWLTGAVPGYEPLLMPVVHSLLQVKAEIEAVASEVTDDELWQRPAGVASVGFHIRHIGGSTERLLTYARGEQLTPAQLGAAQAESSEQVSREILLRGANAALDRGLAQVHATTIGALLEERKVGRAGLPSTTIGLLFHLAEHATRHAGQALTTARIVKAGTTRDAG